jgi:hypothetical protein
MSKLDEAEAIIKDLGLPRAQQNERSALCLLALLDLKSDDKWTSSKSPLRGITPIMEFALEHYGKEYAPNSRETFRRQTMHQFVSAGLAVYNPDNPQRPVNSPKAVYQIEHEALELLRQYGKPDWPDALKAYLSVRDTLSARYANVREQNRIPVTIADGKKIDLSPGLHSELIKTIIEEFGSRFVPGGQVVYVGDTGEKWGYYDEPLLKGLNVTVDAHGKMPDVVMFYPERNWLLLIESVTSHGPVDGKRRIELMQMFSKSSAGLVYVTAFPSRALMMRYLPEIAWETEVWLADSPSHLIHFNGNRFLGPY